MVAVIGRGAADHADEIARASDLTVANDNSPQQIVLSGAKAHIPAAIEARLVSSGCARWSSTSPAPFIRR